MSNLLSDLLGECDYLLADGATGTNMMGMGLPAGQAPDLWNLDRPGNVDDLRIRRAGGRCCSGVAYGSARDFDDDLRHRRTNDDG